MTAAAIPTGAHVASRRRVVGLIRVSTAEQAQDHRGGIPRQRRVIEETIKVKGLDCLNIYEISDVSGTEVLKNAKIIEILGLVRTGIVQGLVVADLDRLFRPTEPTDYAILQVFKDTGAVIFSCEVEYNLGTKDGQLLSGIRSAISAFEIQLMKERQHGAKEEKRRKGHCPTNRLTMPFGTRFDRVTQRWEWTQDAPKVAEVFRLVDEMGERNYSKLGRQFGVTNVTIRNWLRNPIYMGLRVWNQKRGQKRVSRSGKTYRVKVSREEHEVIQVKVLDALISSERWERVQAVLATTRFNHIERLQRSQSVNLGAGIAWCSCGERFYCSSGKKATGTRHGYYQCRANYYLHKAKLGGCVQPNIPQPKLDELIIRFASEILTSQQTLVSLIETALRRSAEVLRPFPGFNGSADGRVLAKREKRLLDAYEAGVIELPELRKRQAELRKCATLADKASFGEQGDNKVFATTQFVSLVVKGAFRVARETDPNEQKKTIQGLLDCVVIKGRALIGFRLTSELRPGGASEIVYLAEPFNLPSEAELPSGMKRCIRCGEVKHSHCFRLPLNRCRTCVALQEREARTRRLATRANIQTRGMQTE